MDIFTTYFLLILILALGFFIRMPYFNFPMDEDAGFYTYIPYFYDRGLRFVKDFWGIFPPTLILLIQCLYKKFDKNIKTVRIFACFIHLFTILSVFWLSRYLFGTGAALFSALLYAIYASAPFLAWFSIHTENYYLLPVTWGLYFCLLGTDMDLPLLLLLSGMMFSVGFLFKIVVAGYFILLGGFLCVVKEHSFFYYFLAGFVVPTILCLILQTYFLWGQNKQLWMHMKLRLKGLHNISWQYWDNGILLTDFIELFLQTFPVWSGIALYFLMPVNEVLIIYGVATLIIFIVQRGFSSYHYLPIIHLLSIHAGGVLGEMGLNTGIFVCITLMIFSLLHSSNSAWLLCFSPNKFRRYLSSEKSTQYLYLPYIAEDIKNKMTPENRLYVWGPYTQIYQMCDRPGTDHYHFSLMGPYDRKDFSFYYDTVVGGIIKYKPAYILETHLSLNMQALSKNTGINYSIEKIYYNKFILWRLKDVSRLSIPATQFTWEKKNRQLEEISSGDPAGDIAAYYIDNDLLEVAENERKEAFKINPYDFDNHILNGIIMREMKRYNEAMDIFNKLLTFRSAKRFIYNVYFHRGITRKEQGDFNGALADLNKAGKINSLYSCAFTHMGIIYRYKGEHTRALEYFKKALAKVTENNMRAYILYQKGSMLEILKKMRHACELFETALKINGLHKKLEYGINFHLGNIYNNLSERKKSIDCYNRCLRILPDHKGAQTGLKAVQKNNLQV